MQEQNPASTLLFLPCLLPDLLTLSFCSKGLEAWYRKAWFIICPQKVYQNFLQQQKFLYLYNGKKYAHTSLCKSSDIMRKMWIFRPQNGLCNFHFRQSTNFLVQSNNMVTFQSSYSWSSELVSTVVFPRLILIYFHYSPFDIYSRNFFSI